jgi:hypothetical protein
MSDLLGNLIGRLTDRIEVILGPTAGRLGAFLFEKLPSPVIAIVGGVFVIVGVLEMVRTVSCEFCISFEFGMAVTAAGFYILKRKYSGPNF